MTLVIVDFIKTIVTTFQVGQMLRYVVCNFIATEIKKIFVNLR